MGKISRISEAEKSFLTLLSIDSNPLPTLRS